MNAMRWLSFNSLDLSANWLWKRTYCVLRDVSATVAWRHRSFRRRDVCSSPVPKSAVTVYLQCKHIRVISCLYKRSCWFSNEKNMQLRSDGHRTDTRTLHEKQPSVDIIFPPKLLGYNSGSMGNVGMSPKSGGPMFGTMFEPADFRGLMVDRQWPCNK